MNHQAWRDRALCAEVGVDLFFPERGEPSRPAKSVCSRCEVRDECLDYALEHDIRFGVWGMTSEFERRKMRNQASQARKAAA